MKVPISIGVIIGIAAGGVVIVCGICVLLIRLILRSKHKRRMAQIATGIEGTLSRVPSSHMHISDEDVARMPGNNATARQSLQGHYNRSAYTPMPSREKLESQTILKNLERGKSSSRVSHGAVVPLQSWPLPRRLTRSDGTPLANTPISITSPKKRIEEKTTTPTRCRGMRLGYALDNKTRPTSLEIIQNKLGSELPPSPGLKPKPLFHNDPPMTENKTLGNSPVADAKDCRTKSTPRSYHSRSVSVCSQDPGAAPTHVLPPLPFEIPSRVKQNMKSATDFSACGSLFSDNTSILNDEESRALSRAETDLTSIGVSSPRVSPHFSESRTRGLCLWGAADSQEKASPIKSSKALNLRPQINTQKSFRASIQYTLPRNETDGPSMSILDHVPQRGSIAKSLIDAPRANPKPKISSPSSTGKNRTSQSNSQSSPLGLDIDSKDQEDIRSKRASITVLNPISGNDRASVMVPQEGRPSSIATDDPFQWNPHTAMPPGMPPDRLSGRKRQDCVRISNVPLIGPALPKAARFGDRDQPLDTTVSRSSHRDTVIRPPSKATFDLHFTPGRGRVCTKAPTPPRSPTLATFNFYEEVNSSPDSAIETPTKKPGRRISSFNHLSNIFDNPFTTSWRLPSPSTEESTGPIQVEHNTQPTALYQNGAQDSPSTDRESRPPSFLFNFPNPPKRVNYPSWHGPKTPIRGPRVPPHDFHKSPTRRRSSRSPSRSPPKSPPRSPSRRISKRCSNSPNFDLRRSIMALRRQNSEVNNHQSKGSREHKRYLSIGDDVGGVSAIFGNDGKENETQGEAVKRSKVLPDFDDGVEIDTHRRPSSFYDGDGFFQGE